MVLLGGEPAPGGPAPVGPYRVDQPSDEHADKQVSGEGGPLRHGPGHDGHAGGGEGGLQAGEGGGDTCMNTCGSRGVGRLKRPK